MTDVELFSGAGAATIGLRRAGLDPVGFELDPDACATHHAAGHRTVRADLSAYQWPATLRGQVRLLHGSPPCQPFSTAGDGAGDDDERDGMPWMLRAVAELRPAIVTIENVPGLTFERHRDYFGACLAELRGLGYDVDWRILNAADFGVAQVRKRLIIVGRRDGRSRWPEVTHTDGGGLFLAPWVSAGEACGWDERDIDRPAPVVTGKAGGSWQRRPARTVCGNRMPRWVYDRPATTVACDQRLSAPGHHDPGVSGSQQADAVRVTLPELAALQAFPADYPFVGNKTSIARQIGNACPPPLIEAVVRANLGAARAAA